MRVNLVGLLLLTILVVGCSRTLTRLHCGDGVVDPDEECDDGNSISGDGCDAQCMMETLDDQDTLTGDKITDSDSDWDSASNSDSESGDNQETDTRPVCASPNQCMPETECRNAGGDEVSVQKCLSPSNVCCALPAPPVTPVPPNSVRQMTRMRRTTNATTPTRFQIQSILRR